MASPYCCLSENKYVCISSDRGVVERAVSPPILSRLGRGLVWRGGKNIVLNLVFKMWRYWMGYYCSRVGNKSVRYCLAVPHPAGGWLL